MLVALAQRLRISGAKDAAVSLLRRSLVHHPRDFWLFFELGHSSEVSSEQAGAFRAALAIRPQSAYVYFGLGFVLYGERKLDEAMDCYRRPLELDPKNAGVHANLGMVLDDQHQGRLA